MQGSPPEGDRAVVLPSGLQTCMVRQLPLVSLSNLGESSLSLLQPNTGEVLANSLIERFSIWVCLMVSCE